MVPSHEEDESNTCWSIPREIKREREKARESEKTAKGEGTKEKVM